MKKLFLYLACLLCGSGLSAQTSQLPVWSNDLLTTQSGERFGSIADKYLTQLDLSFPPDTAAEEGGIYRSAHRWLRHMGSRVANDAPPGTPTVAPVNLALKLYLANKGDYCTGTGSFRGNWRCMGPYINTYNGVNGMERSGRIESIWVSPTDTSYILAGGNTGGLWKSTDAGLTWRNITDASADVLPGTFGVHHIAVNPQNGDIIYLSTGVDNHVREKAWGYGTGLVYSTNAGLTWQADPIVDTLPGFVGGFGELTGKVAYMPGTQKLFYIYKNRAMYRPSPQDPWEDITHTDMTAEHRLMDIEFTKDNPGTAIISGYHKDGELWVWRWNSSTGFAPPSQLLPAGNYSLYSNAPGVILDMSVSATDRVYFHLATRKLTGSGLENRNILLRYDPVEDTSGVLADPVVPADYNYRHIEVSPSNENIIYMANHYGYADQAVYRYRVDIDARTSISVGCHADGRCLLLYSSTNTTDGIDDVLYAGTDGGIIKKRKGATHFISITGDSLAVTQHYGLAGTEATEDIIFSGAQDNGGVSFIKGRPLQWESLIPYGDGYKTQFTRGPLDRAYIGLNYRGNKQVMFTANAITGDPAIAMFPEDVTSYNGNPLRTFQFDAANRAFGAEYLCWTKTLAEYGWTKLFEPGTLPHNPPDLEWKLCTNLNFIFPEKEGYEGWAYLGYAYTADSVPIGEGNRFGKLYVAKNIIKSSGFPWTTQDGWINITPGTVEWHRITDFTIDPEHPERIWIALGDIKWGDLDNERGPDDRRERVYYSPDAGDTWTDVSHGMPPLPVNKILYLEGSNDVLLAGTDVGVFRCDFSSFDPQEPPVNGVNPSVRWQCFNDGLPNVLVQDMEVNYCGGKLRIATFGRGVWETDLYHIPGYSTNPTVGSVLSCYRLTLF